MASVEVCALMSALLVCSVYLLLVPQRINVMNNSLRKTVAQLRRLRAVEQSTVTLSGAEFTC